MTYRLQFCLDCLQPLSRYHPERHYDDWQDALHPGRVGTAEEQELARAKAKAEIRSLRRGGPSIAEQERMNRERDEEVRIVALYELMHKIDCPCDACNLDDAEVWTP